MSENNDSHLKVQLGEDREKETLLLVVITLFYPCTPVAIGPTFDQSLFDETGGIIEIISKTRDFYSALKTK